MRTVALYEMLFGLLTIAGGVIGFVTADSTASLIAGVLCGIALLVSGLAMQRGSRPGLFAALVISVALLVNFGRGYIAGDTTPAFMPAGLMSILAIISLLLLLLLLVQPKERKRIF